MFSALTMELLCVYYYGLLELAMDVRRAALKVYKGDVNNETVPLRPSVSPPPVMSCDYFFLVCLCTMLAGNKKKGKKKYIQKKSCGGR